MSSSPGSSSCSSSCSAGSRRVLIHRVVLLLVVSCSSRWSSAWSSGCSLTPSSRSSPSSRSPTSRSSRSSRWPSTRSSQSVLAGGVVAAVFFAADFLAVVFFAVDFLRDFFAADFFARAAGPGRAQLLLELLDPAFQGLGPAVGGVDLVRGDQAEAGHRALHLDPDQVDEQVAVGPAGRQQVVGQGGSPARGRPGRRPRRSPHPGRPGPSRPPAPAPASRRSGRWPAGGSPATRREPCRLRFVQAPRPVGDARAQTLPRSAPRRALR